MDNLRRIFDTACVLSTFLSKRSDYRPDANKIAHAVSQQLNQEVSLDDLSRIKYLLPDEIVFDYEDIVFDAVNDRSEPQKVLLFQFVDTVKDAENPGSLLAKITQRKERFQRAASQFMSRRSWDDLVEGAKSMYPRSNPNISMEIGPLKGESMDEIIDSLDEELAAKRTVPPRPSSYAPTPSRYEQLLSQFGIEKLYSHQAQAIEFIEEGKNVIITTSTASGKSLVFQMPIVDCLQSGEGTAMYLSPTKALAQDQLRSFRNLLDEDLVYAFDGDTPANDRQGIIEEGRLILCNPDILHCTILPQWQKWQRFLENLRFVVLDELHCYQGVFGAHTAMVFRRLRRLCFDLGNDQLQFIACSATIDKPLHFFSQITGLEEEQIRMVDNDGSPAGKKHFLFINTPHLVEDDPSSGRALPMTIAVPLLIRLVSSGLRVIAFCRVRKVCELMMRSIREQLRDQDNGEEILSCIMSYRGGYAPEKRREIEREMFCGKLRAVIATSALEIGIDIGNLDAAVLVGFPYSLASFRQQVGRVGRRSTDSLVAIVADGSVLDRTFVNDPDRIFTDRDPLIPLPIEPAIVSSHLDCAAYELALTEEDGEVFPLWESLKHSLEFEDGQYHTSKYRPAEKVSLRVADSTDIAVVNVTGGNCEILEMIEFSRIGFTIYEGAIFHHQGKPYIVVKLNTDENYAHVIETKVQWTTRQRDFTDVDPLSSQKYKTLNDALCAIGKVQVATTVFGYFKVDRRNKIIEAVDVYLPPFEAKRAGIWMNLSIAVLETITEKNLNAAAAIHAAEHLIISMIPRFVVTSPGDLGTECKAPEKELAKKATGRIRLARLIIFERRGGEAGNGTVEKVYECLDQILDACCERIDACPCTHGCLDCIAMSGCTENNIVLSKPGAQVILRMLMNHPIDDVPDGPEPNFEASDIITVQAVQAHPVVNIKKEE
ncbi:ATP-dependent helicase HRQ1 [Wickerhamiella sorbophila]|uniref:ATP-dependent helicase HRQ1 n=1 Tax=Wickerhamiella sorbophila TaxID=45607 RepID=A0A2T0FCZ3_9ASCO|nr:ATP-dependent helicase HRQ1 [Wickerhamiella sorbophila]PRT52883.1 ATP-dependent helicase HRQ1 [Wickerhamiella sorbophila]